MAVVSRQSLSASPDSNHAEAAPSMHTQNQKIGESVIIGRKRVTRACDKCSNSRTRCDGTLPCHHCRNYGFACSYKREQRPRGRAASKRIRIENSSTAISSSLSELHRTSSSSTQTITPTSPSFEAVGDRPTQSDSSQSFHDHNGATQHSSTSHNATTRDQYRRSSSNNTYTEIFNPRPECLQLPDSLEIQQNIGTPANFHSLYVDETNYRNFSQFDFLGNPVPSLPTAIYSTVGNPVTQANETDRYSINASPIDRSRIRPISRIGFVMPGTPQFRPTTAFGKPSGESQVPQGCRYLVLFPLLQLLHGVVPINIACDLLDLYFAEPSSSLFESASPYVLTHIFRRKSFLHPTKPRVTSPALLAAMLWVTAQTSDAQIFKTSPTSRGRICDKLFAICLRLLNPLLYENPRTPPEKMPNPERSHNGTVRDGIQSTGTLDDVLTLTLLGIVVSGGDFKSDCQKWWRAAWALGKELKLGQEVDEDMQNTLGSPDSPYESPDGSGQSESTFGLRKETLTEEQKEERRRTWWLLYIADRHLALSFNAPLHILEAECHLYQPLDDASWQDLDPEVPADRYFGPSTKCTGVGLFEYFLPLMVILGDIIDIHHRSCHPRFGALENTAAISQVESLLEGYEQSLQCLSHSPSLTAISDPTSDFHNPPLTTMHSRFNFPHSPTSKSTFATLEARKKIVVAYATHILHVLHILLHGKWDPISMLDDLDNWTTSPSFVKCASHSVAAAEAVSQILKFDPELSFMPYLFGIYLLHGSFILLLFADKMQIEANPTVRQACETMIRAHEVCVATLNTEYQRNFRKVLRSALYDARGIVSIDIEEQRMKRREFLSLYRWANNGTGLAL